MAANKYFTENWIVVFGVVLICVTYYKYEKDAVAKNNTFIKKNVPVDPEKKVINSFVPDIPRSLASDKDEEPKLENSKDEFDIFNPAERFKRAVNHHAKKTKPAQNFSNVSVRPHNLLQNTRWKLWNQTQVVKSAELLDPNDALAQVSNLSVVQSTEDANLSEFDMAKPVAVFDERLKKVGVLTGVLKVQTADKEKLKEDLKNIQAEISDEFDSIQTYFIRSQLKVFNLEELYENLKSQDYILNVELEIINRSFNKN